LLELWEATRASGHELLLEVIAPDGNADEAVLRAVKRFYNLGLRPDWWKLAPMQAASWQSFAALVAERDPHCRGAVILGLNQPLETLAQGFAQATHPIFKGFMVGRTIWGDASHARLADEIDDGALVERSAERFGRLVQAWRARKESR
jgi:5-dehydro-2-deoxygluconokinase